MSRKRCTKCKVEYKGHRPGEHHPPLKTLYERVGATGVFTKVGYRCPECNSFYPYNEKKEEKKKREYEEAGDLSELSYDLRG